MRIMCELCDDSNFRVGEVSLAATTCLALLMKASWPAVLFSYTNTPRRRTALLRCCTCMAWLQVLHVQQPFVLLPFVLTPFVLVPCVLMPGAARAAAQHERELVGHHGHGRQADQVRTRACMCTCARAAGRSGAHARARAASWAFSRPPCVLRTALTSSAVFFLTRAAAAQHPPQHCVVLCPPARSSSLGPRLQPGTPRKPNNTKHLVLRPPARSASTDLNRLNPMAGDPRPIRNFVRRQQQRLEDAPGALAAHAKGMQDT